VQLIASRGLEATSRADLLAELISWRLYLSDLEAYERAFPDCISPSAYVRSWARSNGVADDCDVAAALKSWDERFAVSFRLHSGLTLDQFAQALAESRRTVQARFQVLKAALEKAPADASAQEVAPEWQSFLRETESLYQLLGKVPQEVLVA